MVLQGDSSDTARETAQTLQGRQLGHCNPRPDVRDPGYMQQFGKDIAVPGFGVETEEQEIAEAQAKVTAAKAARSPRPRGGARGAPEPPSTTPKCYRSARVAWSPRPRGRARGAPEPLSTTALVLPRAKAVRSPRPKFARSSWARARSLPAAAEGPGSTADAPSSGPSPRLAPRRRSPSNPAPSAPAARHRDDWGSPMRADCPTWRRTANPICARN